MNSSERCAQTQSSAGFLPPRKRHFVLSMTRGVLNIGKCLRRTRWSRGSITSNKRGYLTKKTQSRRHIANIVVVVLQEFEQKVLVNSPKPVPMDCNILNEISNCTYIWQRTKFQSLARRVFQQQTWRTLAREISWLRKNRTKWRGTQDRLT